MTIGKRAAAVLASLRVGPYEEAAFDFEFRHDNPGEGDIARWALGRLERQVGGAERLDALDAEPLPDEAFEWAGIPDDIGDSVREVLHLVDNCCDLRLDVEYRTACRRLLAGVSSTGPDVFRRGAKAQMSAAAVVWVVGKVNDVFDLYRKDFQVKEFMSHFGLTGSVSQRGGAMLHAAQFESDTHDLTLGSPRYLVGKRRSALIDARHRYRAFAVTKSDAAEEASANLVDAYGLDIVDLDR